MHPAFPRSPVVRTTLGALCLLFASVAIAQPPPPLTCDITGPSEVSVGEAFELCGPVFANTEYFWRDQANVIIATTRCLPFPNGLPAPGVYIFEFAMVRGGEILKCPVDVTVVDEPPPPPGRCWLTGGGGKVDDASGHTVHSYGGNINPGCSPTAGQGGNWNDVAHDLRLHFQGRAIEVIRCGNMPGIPPGSDSPVTPFNFIEFRGTGTLKGIKGNKVDHGTVYFFGHYEDREEPGSHGQPDPDERDRYFLHVFSDPGNPNGTTLLLVDVDGNPATVDPVTVSHGNLQLHISSCEDDGTGLGTNAAFFDEAEQEPAVLSLPAEISFAAPSPNPTERGSLLKFALPREADVSLKVYDVAGREVSSLVSGRVTPGQHAVTWDLTDQAGSRVSRGLYFVRLAVDGKVWSQTVTVR